MRLIEALAEYEPNGETSLFLAGGISGCPDWQSEMVALLSDAGVLDERADVASDSMGGQPLTLLNPRRRVFLPGNAEAEAQILWEFRHLRKADALLFWFPCETLCPISLYELGAWSMTDRPLFVGTHPDYPRRLDVEIQTRLARPDVPVQQTLPALAQSVLQWFEEKMKKTDGQMNFR
jgi:Nucleoside 2-deoxyribosyltransferase like